jgi:DNA repair photolyase
VIVKEISPKSVLSGSRVSDYTVNPYVGCAHACVYCYARFMKRFTGHREQWGEFVDVKRNAPELLERAIRRKRKGSVWVSGVCDPYQPIEAARGLTRGCLEILAEHRWPATIQTKSPLVLRDIELLASFEDVEVGMTITTADEEIRRIFEPHAPPIGERLDALRRLHDRGIRTFAMIAPALPGSEMLAASLKGIVDHVLIDRMNYHYADRLYRRHGLEEAMSDLFFSKVRRELAAGLNRAGLAHQFLY